MSNEEKIKILEEKRDKINEISPCFCSAKWLQTTLYLQNGYNHSCHHPSAHKIPLEEIEKNPAALHNSKYKKEQRAKMLNGKRPTECSYCWKIEDLNNNYFSDRHYKTSDYWAWDRFDEISKSNPDDDIYPSYLEVSFANTCNFACAYCSPEISSTWMKDIKKDGPYLGNIHSLDFLKKNGKMPYLKNEYNPYIDAFWKWFPEAFKHLKVLRITGGEPTMSKDTWKVLDFLIENPHPELELAINSNLGVTPELIDKLILKINQLHEVGMKVDIYTSIESTKEQAEYVRDGLDYEYWLSNINKVLSNTESTVAVMTTINILSLPSFTDFIEMIMQLRTKYNHGFEYNRIPMSINILHWPKFLQCIMLGEEVRKEIATNIYTISEGWLKYYSKEKYARIYLEEWDQIKRLCDYLTNTKTDIEHRETFIKFIDEYDKRRNKNFSEIFPTYKYLKKEWNA